MFIVVAPHIDERRKATDVAGCNAEDEDITRPSDDGARANAVRENAGMSATHQERGIGEGAIVLLDSDLDGTTELVVLADAEEGEVGGVATRRRVGLDRESDEAAYGGTSGDVVAANGLVVEGHGELCEAMGGEAFAGDNGGYDVSWNVWMDV